MLGIEESKGPRGFAYFATYEARREAVVAIIHPLQANIWANNCERIRWDKKAYLRSTSIRIGNWVQILQGEAAKDVHRNPPSETDL